MKGGLLHRKCACGGSCGKCGDDKASAPVPRIVHDVLRSPGQPLDAATRAAMEPRFGHDFSRVRVHTGARERQSAHAVHALAYAAGNHIVLGHPSVSRDILAHELAHVTQHRGGDALPTRVAPANSRAEQEADRAASAASPVTTPADGSLHRYRPPGAFSSAQLDDDVDPFFQETAFTDPATQPWIEKIDVLFNRTTNTGSENIPSGELVATYAPNAVAFAPVRASISGGSPGFDLTHIVKNRKITRIEGFGYNDVPFKKGAGQGPKNKYAVQDAAGMFNASMHYALFFKAGQAIHAGSLTVGSHACVHSDIGPMRQINYHSVRNKTVVNVDYTPSALDPVCCELFAKREITQRGEAPQPCNRLSPAKCGKATP